MIEITRKKVLICSVFLIVLAIVVVNVRFKSESIKLESYTIEQLVFADSTTVEDVQADVVFSLSDEAVYSPESSLEGIEKTVQSAISTASNQYIEEKEKELKEELERKRQEEAQRKANAVEIKGEAILSYNPFIKSNLSVEQYNIILKGTGLEGCGQSFYNMEQSYDVNGLFAIGVAFHESAYGRAKANTNNFYGMRGNNGWMAFSSPDENIQYFGRLMNKSLYYGKSIVNIGKIYCPGTYDSWASKVKFMMRSSFDKI